MSFYGTTFYNLIGWLFKKGNREIEMGPTSENRTVNLGTGLELVPETRTISVIPCVLNGEVDGTTLKLNIIQQTNNVTTVLEQEEE